MKIIKPKYSLLTIPCMDKSYDCFRNEPSFYVSNPVNLNIFRLNKVNWEKSCNWIQIKQLNEFCSFYSCENISHLYID